MLKFYISKEDIFQLKYITFDNKNYKKESLNPKYERKNIQIRPEINRIKNIKTIIKLMKPKIGSLVNNNIDEL